MDKLAQFGKGLSEIWSKDPRALPGHPANKPPVVPRPGHGVGPISAPGPGVGEGGAKENASVGPANAPPTADRTPTTSTAPTSVTSTPSSTNIETDVSRLSSGGN